MRVPLDEPAWWYRAEPSIVSTCLQPLATVYAWAAMQRFARAEPYRSPLPVVCVGNFTAGGTGKTPLVIYLCEHLKQIGWEPAILTRGYGGSIPGPYWVNPRSDAAADVGDEALLLGRAAPTQIARDRRAGARAIERGPHGATVIIMDDGLQNPSLVKDLRLAVVDGKRGIGNGRVLPAGPLRGPLQFQLEMTDAIVINKMVGDVEDGTMDWLRDRFVGPVLRCSTVAVGDTTWLAGARILAWAGIGGPQRFFALLSSLGAELTAKVVFPDHHRIADDDAQYLLDQAQRLRAALVTTEKDMARLTAAAGLPAELAAASRYLPVKLQFGSEDAERLAGLLNAALATR